MDKVAKKVKRKDYRIDCFKKALVGVKKAHLFRMQKAIRNLRKTRKISEKPLPDDLAEEEREKKTAEITKTIQKFEKQIKRLDSIVKKDMRTVALYMLKKDFEISFDKQKTFFEKAVPGFEELLEQMEKESGENLDTKWFYSLILTTKPVQQAKDAVREVLEKVDKVKDRSKNKRKTKKARAIERKRLKELGILPEEDEESPETAQDVEYDVGDSEQEVGMEDDDEDLEDMVSIDYGSDAEMEFDENDFDDLEEEKVPPPKAQADKKTAQPSKARQDGAANAKKGQVAQNNNKSTEKATKAPAFPQEKQLPTFKEKVHNNRERNGPDHKQNRYNNREDNSNRNFKGRGDFQGRDDSRGGRGDFKRRDDFQGGGRGGFKGRDDSRGGRGGFRGRDESRGGGRGGFRGRDESQGGGRGDFRGRDDSRGGRGDFRGRDESQGGRGDFTGRQPQNFERGDNQRGPKKDFNAQQSAPGGKPSFGKAPANYHPSWQARLEQRSTEAIVPFQGKKIKL